MEPVTVYLGLGSNLRNRQENLEKALKLISDSVSVKKVSSIYDTEPMGNTKQPRFLNMVCNITTTLAPMELLILMKGIESKLGRVPSERNAPRIIDIDILLYGEQIVDTPKLIIPHPRMVERAFVLIPLVEIAPDLVHPVSGKTTTQLLEALKKGVQGVFKLNNI